MKTLKHYIRRTLGVMRRWVAILREYIFGTRGRRAWTLFVTLLSGLGLVAGLYQDLWKPVFSSKEVTDRSAADSDQGNTSAPSDQRVTPSPEPAPTGSAETAPEARDPVFWWGLWNRDEGAFDFMSLYIFDTTTRDFRFELSGAMGARTGQIEGITTLVNDSSAEFEVAVGWEDRSPCRLDFAWSHEREELVITETPGCGYFGGMGLSFGGRFTREYDPLVGEAGIHETIAAKLLDSFGPRKYRALKERFQIIQRSIDDEFTGATTVIGYAAGMYGFWDGIVTFDNAGRAWAAYLDDDTVYATNHLTAETPSSERAAEWMKRFTDRKLVVVGQ